MGEPRARDVVERIPLLIGEGRPDLLLVCHGDHGGGFDSAIAAGSSNWELDADATLWLVQLRAAYKS